jgi:hypothetical protein
MATKQPDLGLGCEAAGWWSREAQPQMPAWSAGKPGRLVEKTVPAKAPEGKALAGYGRYGPTANQMLWRVVRGRPLSVVTGVLRAWLAMSFTAQGTRALGRIWDHASWHVRQAGQAWIKGHHRQATPAGGGRLMIWRRPRKRPWRNPIEPTWVHGQRAVGEPARVLPMAELIQRVCASYQCDLTDPIAQPDC